MPYKRILCFESELRGSPPMVVGDIFRALAPFLAGPPRLKTVAMPVVAAGDQGYSIADMLPSLLQAAINWIRAGMPLEKLKIVVPTPPKAATAREVFARFKADAHMATSRLDPSVAIDAFMSYAHEDVEAADILAGHLKGKGLKLFIDRDALLPGTPWQTRIFEAIDNCKRLVAIYSPAYVTSKVCQEEFNIAWARGRRLDRETIFPVYWSSAELPTYMTMLTFADSRERQSSTLEAVARQIADACASY